MKEPPAAMIQITTLSPIEQQIMAAIAALEEVEGKAQTGEIAFQVSLSKVQTWRYLQQLARLGLIQKIGVRGGWKQIPAVPAE